MASWAHPCVLNVNEWMKKADDLVIEITNLVALNNPEESSMIVYPHLLPEIMSGVIDLGYKDVNHFCESFSSKFIVDHATNVITLPKTSPAKKEEESVEKIPEPELEVQETSLQKVKIREETSVPLCNSNPVPPALTTGMIVEKKQADASYKKADRIHFKFCFEGKIRRFAIYRDDSDLIGKLKARVHKIIGKKAELYWRDEDSAVVLDSNDDMHAAIDYAERMKKPPCIEIEFTVVVGEEEERKEEVETVQTRVTTRDESCAAFNNFAFMCDSCDVYLTTSNGGRFKCIVCDNYDLCAACVAKGAHDNENHALIRLLNESTIVPITNEEGVRRNGQLKETKRCTPLFVVSEKSEKPTVVIGETLLKANEMPAQTNSDLEEKKEHAQQEEMQKAQEVPVNIIRKDAHASKQAALVHSFDRKFDAYVEKTMMRERGGITRREIEERLKLKFMQSMETWEKRWEWQSVEAEMRITMEEGDAKLASFFEDLGRATPMTQENPLFEMMQHEDREAWRIMEEQAIEQRRQQQEERERRIEEEAAFVTRREVAIRELLAPTRAIDEEQKKEEKKEKMIEMLEEGRVKIETLMREFSLNDKQEEQRVVEVADGTLTVPNAPISWSRGTGAAIAAKWKEDELLGDKATEMAVLYANLNNPDLKKQILDWNDRADFINKTWVELSWHEKAIYMQKALCNQTAQQAKMIVAAAKKEVSNACAAFDSVPLGPKSFAVGSISTSLSERWKAEEPLGEKAKLAAVLYVNLTFPDLQHYMLDWNDRFNFIQSTWRELPADVRQMYIQMARVNRSESQSAQKVTIATTALPFNATTERSALSESSVDSDTDEEFNRLLEKREAEKKKKSSSTSSSNNDYDNLSDDEFEKLLKEHEDQLDREEEAEKKRSEAADVSPSMVLVQEEDVESNLAAALNKLEIRLDQHVLSEIAVQTEVALPDTDPQPVAHACACTCDESQKIEGKWPSERWLEGWDRYGKQGPAPEKFMQDSKEFLARTHEIRIIADHLERLLLKEACKKTTSPMLMTKEIEQFYCRVSNNIRLHVFHIHDKILSDSRDVENEMIRLIATDVAKRLLTMHFSLSNANVDICFHKVELRICELDAMVECTKEDLLECRIMAMNLRRVLLNNDYAIFYDTSETGFDDVGNRAREFYVQLNIQREDTRMTVLAERKKEEEKEKLTEQQQTVLGRLFDTGIFEDYDKMIEVCRVARNLEQAIEMMLGAN